MCLSRAPPRHSESTTLTFALGIRSEPRGRSTVEGGEETEVVPEPVGWPDWALSRNGIYYATVGQTSPRELFSIQFLDLKSAQVTELLRVQGFSFHRSLAISPNEEWVLYGEGAHWTSELVLIENFR